jgi:hypothetical protein
MLDYGDLVAERTRGCIVGMPARKYHASLFRAERSEAPVQTRLAQCLGALVRPGTLVGAGGRRPRLDGADSRPIFMPKHYQIEIHQTEHLIMKLTSYGSIQGTYTWRM